MTPEQFEAALDSVFGRASHRQDPRSPVPRKLARDCSGCGSNMVKVTLGSSVLRCACGRVRFSG